MKDFRVQIASDVNFEQLIAEIYYEDKFFALISQEKGTDHLMVEFAEEAFNDLKLPYNLLLEALGVARSKLLGEKSKA